MQKLKPWLLIALVFLAGFASGVFASHIAIRNFIRHSANDPNYLRATLEQRMTRRLRLDAGQRARVHETLVSAHQDLQQLRGNFQPQFLAIMQRAQTNIAAVLTPEQRRKFEKFQEENRHLWQPH